MRYVFVLLILCGCAAQQVVTLLPRGGGQKGSGSFDHIHQVLTVELNGEVYKGRPITKTATTSPSLFTIGTTTTSNEESALLIGPAGQVRCDYAWGVYKAQANGVCVDHRNVTYDLLIQN
jgi:hypothetical protein